MNPVSVNAQKSTHIYKKPIKSKQLQDLRVLSVCKKNDDLCAWG